MDPDVYRQSQGTLPDPLPILPLAAPAVTTLRPPGSKSITNRVYALAALAEGVSRLERPLRSDDTDRLLVALRTLGVGSHWEDDTLVVSGAGGCFPAAGRVDLGDGGTPARFMLALAARAAGPVVVDGSPRMRERLAEGVALLGKLGVAGRCLNEPERLPVEITPAPILAGRTLEVPTTASSQFISALLLIAPWLTSPLTLEFTGKVTSQSYVELTVGVLRDWGVRVDEDRETPALTVFPSAVAARTVAIEADASSAVYWWVAGAVTRGSTITTSGIPHSSRQADLAALDALRDMGATATHDDLVRVTTSEPLHGASIDAGRFPDASLALAAAAATASSATTIRGLETLRVKETDRIAALATELRRIGCSVETSDEQLVIDPGPRHDNPVVIDTYNDHRMAMAFAVLGLCRPGIAIVNPACVEKSYPGFWSDLATLYAHRPDRHTAAR